MVPSMTAISAALSYTGGGGEYTPGFTECKMNARLIQALLLIVEKATQSYRLLAPAL